MTSMLPLLLLRRCWQWQNIAQTESDECVRDAEKASAEGMSRESAKGVNVAKGLES